MCLCFSNVLDSIRIVPFLLYQIIIVNEESIKICNNIYCYDMKTTHPVLFETCEYQFAVEFNHLYDTSNGKLQPKVKHRLKSVGEGFKFYPYGRHSGILVGSIDFLNSPGKFSFAFEYFDVQ